MIARPDRYRIKIAGFVGLLALAFAVQQLSEREEGGGWLPFVRIDSTGKHVCHVLGVPGVDAVREG